MEEAERVADEIAVIDHGKIIAQGSAEALKGETGSQTLEDAFIALTGHSIRDEEASSADRMRMMRRVWRAVRGGPHPVASPTQTLFPLACAHRGLAGPAALFLLALGFGFGPTFAKAGGGNYMQFLAPGIISMGILFTAVFSGIEIIWDRQFGFLKETLVAPVSRLKIVLGRTLGGATVALIQGAIVFVVCLIAGFRVCTRCSCRSPWCSWF